MRGFSFRTASVAILATAVMFGAPGCDSGGGDGFSIGDRPLLVCPADIDIVMVIDTSPSMEDDSEFLCARFSRVFRLLEKFVAVHGSDFVRTSFAITGERAERFAPECLTEDVLDEFGPFVPNGGALTTFEDWGPAIAIVAENFAWREDAARVIIPFSDEAPRHGDPCLDPGDDRDHLDNAIAVANANGVVVTPFLGTPFLTEQEPVDTQCVVDFVHEIANGTGGVVIDPDGQDDNHLAFDLLLMVEESLCGPLPPECLDSPSGSARSFVCP